MADISNYDNVIDSRDVIERIEELETELQDAYDKLFERQEEVWHGWLDDPDSEMANEPPKPPDFEDWRDAVRKDNKHELQDTAKQLYQLKSLQDEAEDFGDWKYGATLVRDSYFVDYCQELLQDIGELPKNIPDYLVIDWEATADNLKVDYQYVDFDGVEYLVRS